MPKFIALNKCFFRYNLNMKKIFLIILCLFFANHSWGHEHHKSPLLIASVIKNKIKGDVVVYNLSNGKLHTADCEWAEKCTKNCIYLSKREIKKMFYVPCLVCGGGIIEPVAEEDPEEFSRTDF